MTDKKDYIGVVYNEKDRPLTEYPDKLAKYLVKRYSILPGKTILDLGCGRGEFLRGFIRIGLHGYGVDQSNAAKKLCPGIEIKTADLERDKLPYDNNTFDYIYSKSVIEHFYFPEKLVQEIYRILKPGGSIIAMTPDWEVIYKMFYEDYTHRTPFTITSLKDIFLIHGFNNVVCEKFRQLPFLWDMPWLWPVTSIIAFACPNFLKKSSKIIKFSKEMMLLCTAVKPYDGITK